MKEEWRKIEDLPLYDVSNFGRVRSWNYKGTRMEKPRNLNFVRSKGGYFRVYLRRDGNVNPKLVHRLVLWAFIGPCPEGMECCHNDGNPANNLLENLRWDTRKSNVSDRIKHGGYSTGEKHHMTKLKEVDVIEIRKLHGNGVNMAQIVRNFNTAFTTIWGIIHRKTWRHVA